MNETAPPIGTTDATRRLLFMPILLLSLIASTAAPLPCFAAEAEITVAARVNGVAITAAELGVAMEESRTPGSYHGDTGNIEEKRKTALDRLIDGELVFQEAKRRGLVVEEADIDGVLKAVEGRFKEQSAFETALKKAGTNLKEYRERIRKHEMIKRILKIDVEEKSRCSERELEDYYSANKGKFVTPVDFRVRHYLQKLPPLVTDKERAKIKDTAEALLKWIKQGGETLQWGDIGWIREGGGDEPALVEAATHLNVGETSGLIESIYGFHIIKLEEKIPAKQRPFAEVKDSIKKDLEPKKYKELSSALLTPLRDKAKIEIY